MMWGVGDRGKLLNWLSIVSWLTSKLMLSHCPCVRVDSGIVIILTKYTQVVGELILRLPNYVGNKGHQKMYIFSPMLACKG